MHNLHIDSFRTNFLDRRVVPATMKITKVAAITGGITLGALAGAAFQFSAASAALPAGGHSSVAVSVAVASPTASPSPSPSCPPVVLAIAFTSKVTDTSSLHLRLPWGRP